MVQEELRGPKLCHPGPSLVFSCGTPAGKQRSPASMSDRSSACWRAYQGIDMSYQGHRHVVSSTCSSFLVLCPDFQKLTIVRCSHIRIHIYIYTYMHYITLHYITLHYITYTLHLHYIYSLHWISLHYIPIALHTYFLRCIPAIASFCAMSLRWLHPVQDVEWCSVTSILPF